MRRPTVVRHWWAPTERSCGPITTMVRDVDGMTDPDLADPLPERGPTALRIVSVEDAKEAIATRGRERGFVTSEDMLEILPVEDLGPEQLEEFVTQIEDHLRHEGIEVVEGPSEELDGDLDAIGIRPRDDELLRAPTNDPVRMYLKEIGKVPLLSAAQEVDLAMRIESGEFSTELIGAVENNGVKV